ncbi:MAG: hypothetical protein KF722_09830 [Nitrospira sp.]|nr:hypothetical protein [Nitrospira sp.]
MAAEWRNGFLDALFRSTTERVLRRADRPFLDVPIIDPLMTPHRP